MNKIPFYTIIVALILLTFTITSCDDEFSEIGSGIVDEDHYLFLPNNLSTVKAFTLPTSVVQSNNLPINALGVYTHPVFGTVKANFVTQLELASVNPIFDSAKNPVLDSVVLTIPYFSTRLPSETAAATYRIDSINGSGAFSLKVFESGYVLNNLNPNDNFQTQQRYYTNQDADFNANKIGSMLNNAEDTKQNTAFNPSSAESAKEFVTLKLDRGLKPITPKEVDQRLTPRIRLKLDTAFFKEKIMNAPSGKLLNNNVFKDYFKGIYFQVEKLADGTLVQLDFSRGDITLHYHEYARIVDGVAENYEVAEGDSYGGTPKLVAKTVVLNMRGNTVNLIENTNSNLYNNGLTAANQAEGDANLYIKGGEGSIAVIDLFGPDNFGPDGLTGSPDGVADELNIIRNKGWLINEANLTFFVDREKMGTAPEPQRVYLFDLNNRRPLIDFSNDLTTSTLRPKLSKFVHDGILQEETGSGIKYRVRITNHVRNLIRRDSTNVRLGLSVTESIGLTGNVRLKNQVMALNPLTQQADYKIDRIPVSSVVNPLGTILHGTNIDAGSPNYDKRLKLEIYYTKPN